MQSTDPIMPPILETLSATAWRLRRRLRDLYPATRFRVVTRRGPQGAELVVMWTGDPGTVEVLLTVEPFARTVRGAAAEPTLWASPGGLLALVYPAAERVRIQHAEAHGT